MEVTNSKMKALRKICGKTLGDGIVNNQKICDMTGIEKNMLVGSLRKMDAQDRSLRRLGCKNQLTPACRKKAGFQKKKDIYQHS